MRPYSLEQKQRQHKTQGTILYRFWLTFTFLSLATIVFSLLLVGQFWHSSNVPGQQPVPLPVVGHTPIPSPTPSPTHVPTPTPSPTLSLAQRIDTYIGHLTLTQQIGQLLMLPIYINTYTTALNQPLQQWDIANIIIYTQYNGGPVMPPTLSALTQLVHDLQSHANQALMVSTDEEGGIVD